MSSPPPPNLDPSQLPPGLTDCPPAYPPTQRWCPCSIAGPPPPGPLPAQAATASEHPQDEGSPLGHGGAEAGCQGLEELCKPLYCKLCNVTLNSAQQAMLTTRSVQNGKNHSKKLRNFYAGSQQPTAIRTPEVLESGGHAPSARHPVTETRADSSLAVAQAHYQGKNHAKKLRLAEAQQNASSTWGATRVILATENDYCKLCDASFSSLAVAQAHYQGKNHAKKLRLAEAQQNASSTDGSEGPPRRHRKDCSEYRLMKSRRVAQVLPLVPGPYYNPRPRQRIPRDLAMCVTPSGQFYCSMCNSGAEQEAEFRLHLESKQHKAKVSELRYRNEMENLGYS
ncbi:hypothetical protein CRUP_013694 [Coryphaenoides rupestris]|nr:hypothetical protein CRUP_013694 [Coryphaenoides rupestris]